MRSLIIIFAFSCIVADCNAAAIPDRCNNCQSVIGNVQGNFQNASRENAYHNFLQVCGQMGNLANACNKINATIFNEMYKHLEGSLLPNEFCFKTGECSTDVVVPIIQIVKSIPRGDHDDPACELCKELVKHVVTDLTEDNFHDLIVSGCKELDSFESDCKKLADEYYPLLHDFLIDQLNVKAICSFVGICPGPGLFGAPIPVPKVNTIPKVIPTVQPITQRAPVPVPVPVSHSVNHASGTVQYGHSLNWNPLGNFNPSPALSLAPLAALPAFAAIPLFAIG